MEAAIVTYISVSVLLGTAIRYLSGPREEDPILSPRPSSPKSLPLPPPDTFSNPLTELFIAMGHDLMISGKSSVLRDDHHLSLFQTLSQSLRHDPTGVIARLSAFLCDNKAPRSWKPFALSIRGFAYESMDQWDLARLDYEEGLRRYDALIRETGKENVRRMESNARFMRIRISTLPPPKPRPRVNPDSFVVIQEECPMPLF